MNIKRMLAVLLTLAIVLVSLPIAVSAYSQYGEPECYLTDFKSSNWTIHTGSASIDDNTGKIIANNKPQNIKFQPAPCQRPLKKNSEWNPCNRWNRP